MGAKLAHDLILSPTRWSGTLNVDGDNPAASSANLTIDARSIEIVEAVGGMMSLSDKDRKDIAKNIDDKRPAHEQVPEPEVRLHFGERRGAELHRGRQHDHRRHDPPGERRRPGRRHQVTAKTTISQKDFGIKPFSAMLGAIKLRDDVDFELTRRPALGLVHGQQRGPALAGPLVYLVRLGGRARPVQPPAGLLQS